FPTPVPSVYVGCPIFFLEALVVLVAIHQAVSLLPSGGCLAIYTDNFNAVSLFNTLAALPEYNWLLLSAVDTLLDRDLDLRVFYIPGKENVVADHLSRGRISDALSISPGLVVLVFEPPRDALGVARK
ncbi:hypothetical protein EDC04DRAFT_2579272, partial [Pisolithus marmoratus]